MSRVGKTIAKEHNEAEGIEYSKSKRTQIPAEQHTHRPSQCTYADSALLPRGKGGVRDWGLSTCEETNKAKGGRERTFSAIRVFPSAAVLCTAATLRLPRRVALPPAARVLRVLDGLLNMESCAIAASAAMLRSPTAPLVDPLVDRIDLKPRLPSCLSVC